MEFQQIKSQLSHWSPWSLQDCKLEFFDLLVNLLGISRIPKTPSTLLGAEVGILGHPSRKSLLTGVDWDTELGRLSRKSWLAKDNKPSTSWCWGGGTGYWGSTGTRCSGKPLPASLRVASGDLYLLTSDSLSVEKEHGEDLEAMRKLSW